MTRIRNNILHFVLECINRPSSSNTKKIERVRGSDFVFLVLSVILEVEVCIFIQSNFEINFVQTRIQSFETSRVASEEKRRDCKSFVTLFDCEILVSSAFSGGGKLIVPRNE
jgi:hypothetical protein